MLSKFYQAIRTDWQKLAQERELDRHNSPAAPIQEEVRVYRKLLRKHCKNKKFNHKKALVLGVTPEMRQLALENSYELISIDIDKNMINAMKSLVAIKGRERIINDNWLSLEKYFSNNCFNLILADGSFNNLSYEDYGKLFNILNKLLKDDGIFIIRYLTIAEKDDLKPIDYFCQKNVFWKEKLFGLLLGVKQISKWMNYQKHYLELSKFYRWVLNQLDKRCLSKDMEIVRSFTTSNRNLSGQTEKDFLNIVKNYFVSINKGDDCNFGLTPIYVFKKK